MKTAKLRNGQVVYSKDGKFATGYANKTQAISRYEKLKNDGVDCYITFSHPFYIVINPKFTSGDRVICNGYEGNILRHYSGSMYEVRLNSGVVTVCASNLIKN